MCCSVCVSNGTFAVACQRMCCSCGFLRRMVCNVPFSYFLYPTRRFRNKYSYMSCAVADAALRKRRAIVDVSSEYSHVAPPYGWEEDSKRFDPPSGAVFYTNTVTGDAAWTLPEYSFEESHQACTIQRVWRGVQGIKRFRRICDSFPLAVLVEDAVARASVVGWTGHSYEGMTVEMWLHRAGLSHVCRVLQQDTKVVSISSSFSITILKLQTLTITSTSI